MSLSSEQQAAADRALVAVTYYETLATGNKEMRDALLIEYGHDYLADSMIALVTLLLLFQSEGKYEPGTPLKEIYLGSTAWTREKILDLLARAS